MMEFHGREVKNWIGCMGIGGWTGHMVFPGDGKTTWSSTTFRSCPVEEMVVRDPESPNEEELVDQEDYDDVWERKESER